MCGLQYSETSIIRTSISEHSIIRTLRLGPRVIALIFTLPCGFSLAIANPTCLRFCDAYKGRGVIYLMRTAMLSAVAFALVFTVLNVVFLFKFISSRRTDRLLRLWKVDRSSFTVGFFHPYANAGGGGERVLWHSIDALISRFPMCLARSIPVTGG